MNSPLRHTINRNNSAILAKADQPGISPGQLVMITIVAMGAGTHPLEQIPAGQPGIIWLATSLLSVIWALLCAWLITDTVRRTGKSLPQLFAAMPLQLGKILMLICGMYFFVQCAVLLRSCASMVQLYLLPQTPIEFVMFTTLLPVALLSARGLGAVTRVSGIMLTLWAVTLLGLLLLTTQQFNPLHVVGVLDFDTQDWTQALRHAPTLLIGIETLMFTAPAVRKTKKAGYGIWGAVLGACATVLIIMLCLGMLDEGLFHQPYPTIEVGRAANIRSSMFDRMDMVIMLVWQTITLSMLALYHHLGAVSLTKVLGGRHTLPIALLSIPFIYILAQVPAGYEQLNNWLPTIHWIGAALSIGIPLLLWGWTRISRVKPV